MIILPSTTAVLRARLTAAPATTNPTFVFSYGDEPLTSGQATSTNDGVLNGTTNVSLVTSPAASASRVIPSGFIYNADSAPVNVIVEYYDGTNARQIGVYAIGVGASLVFSDGGFSLPSGTNVATQTIASGTAALGTSAIASAAKATTVTVSAAGVASTDALIWGFNSDPTSTTGYVPSISGMLTIIAYPSSGNVNFVVCNNTGASITPGAVTLNWRVVR